MRALDPQILGTAIKHLVAITTWHPGFVNHGSVISVNLYCIYRALITVTCCVMYCSVDVNSVEMTYSQLTFLKPVEKNS